MALDVPKTFENFDLLRDRVFDEYMKKKIMEEFFNDLQDYFSAEDIDIFRREFSELSDKDFATAISLPYELKQRFFEKMFQAYEEGKSVESIAQAYLDQVSRYDFTIGYHTSPFEILPASTGEWTIKGTEADHRDNDRMMAYYSTQYRHLYKKRHPKFIYAVRSSLADETHKTDGNWHRADSLSVITKVPFDEVVNYVEATVRNDKRLVDGDQRAAAA